MHIHILGICGTFMGGLALLARELGHTVSGVDQQVYPPMSDQLQQAGIELREGYENHGLDTLSPDWVVVGNAMSRGNPAVEYLLDAGLPYCSGPEWLAREVLQGRKVLAVAGTHGKTTTSSLLAWILECAGMNPGFLIGGVPQNFGCSARLGGFTADKDACFVIEADEYDSAFFDKRSKFVHYRPQILVLNNLEFDHADIFEDLAAIQRQFHHLVRTVPGSGCVLLPDCDNLAEVIAQGCWSRTEYLSGANSPWSIANTDASQSHFTLQFLDPESGGSESVDIAWPLCGEHNVENAIAAVAASRQLGVPLATAAEALAKFDNVKRRQELLGELRGVRVYDDFAHHPTAISTTLQGLRKRHPKGRLIAVLEPRSNTMKMGVHNSQIVDSLQAADQVYWYTGQANGKTLAEQQALFVDCKQVEMFDDVESTVATIAQQSRPDDLIVIMSNGGFEGIHQKMMTALAS